MQVNFDVLNLEIVTRNYLNTEVMELGTETGLIFKLKKNSNWNHPYVLKMKPREIFEKETRINSLQILGTDLHCSEPPEQVEPVVLVPCLIMGIRT
jgi:hypothetical protein